MVSNQYELKWRGPFRWYGKDDDVLFGRQEVKRAGIYLWTIPFEKQYLTYYVGETGRSFAVRFTEHTREYLSGLYRLYDPPSFAKGTKVLLWEGMWKPGTRDRMGEFLNQFSKLAPVIHELLRLFRIFIAPLDAESRIRQRIEAAVAHRLYQSPGLIGEFQDQDIRYSPRRSDEKPISIKMSLSEPILGLGDELMA